MFKFIHLFSIYIKNKSKFHIPSLALEERESHVEIFLLTEIPPENIHQVESYLYNCRDSLHVKYDSEH